MNTVECIKTRRSVRRFNEKEVTVQTVTSIVELATYAPSWKNSQTTRYTAVIDGALKARLEKECLMGFEHNMGTVNSAPCIVVVTTVNGRSGYERDGSPTTSKGSHWQSFDAGIATQTFCLAAHELGLATVIMGIFDESKVAEVIGVSEGESVSALIALGYAAELPEMPKKKSADQLLTVK